MRALDLLAAKEIAAVLPIKVVASNSNAGKQHRFRLSMLISTFQWMFEPLGIATAPRASVEGNAETGLLIQFTRNSGFALKPGKETVAVFFISKNISAIEDRVSATQITAYLIQFADGSRALITEPLPTFVPASRLKHTRRTSLLTRAMEFVAAQQPQPQTQDQHQEESPTMSAENPPPVLTSDHDETSEDESPTAFVEPPPAAAPPATSAGQSLTPMHSSSLANLRPVDDLKALIHMFNEQVNSLRDAGANINLRIDEKGQLRGNLQVILSEEL